MNNFTFENVTRVRFGKGCVREYLACEASHFGSTVMLAYGGGSIKRNGIYDEVRGVLEAAGKNVVDFDGIMANPTYEKVLEGAAFARDHAVDLIVGVGGGSVMDCCKAISLAATSERDAWDEYWAKPGVIDVEPLPLGVVVTVAGTGSEMNGGAVITNETTGVKTGRDYPALNPRFALMDPAYTFSVPAMQTASGGFDILSHLMETYFSTPDEANTSDDIMEALMRGVVRDLRAALANPEDYNARSNLMWASSMAENRIVKCGKAGDFQCHQIEHQMGAFTDCNHGCGLAVIHPAYYCKVYRSGLSKFVRFATRVWDVDGNGRSAEEVALAGIDALARFIESIGLPTTLAQLDRFDENDDALLDRIAQTSNVSPGSYRPLSHEEIRELLEECRR